MYSDPVCPNLTRFAATPDFFTKLCSVYRMRTGTGLTDSDFVSFELVDENNMLTNAGVLLADESPMRHSRLFCTRWYGLDKASGIMEALYGTSWQRFQENQGRLPSCVQLPKHAPPKVTDLSTKR